MEPARSRTTLGYGLLGLGIGVILFSIFYLVTVRTQIAQRFVWSWVLIFLAVLLLPAALLAAYGATRKPTGPT